MDSEKKKRVSLYLDRDLVNTADEFLKADGFRSRDALFNSLLEQYNAERMLTGCSDVISEKLSKSIMQLSEDNAGAIAKGLFRYAVELETIIRMLARCEKFTEKDIKEMHKASEYSVRSTKGKIRLKDLVLGNEGVLYSAQTTE